VISDNRCGPRPARVRRVRFGGEWQRGPRAGWVRWRRRRRRDGRTVASSFSVARGGHGFPLDIAVCACARACA